MGLFHRAPQVDAATAARRIEHEDAMVLDVREPAEWSAGHIPGALHIPLGDVDARRGELPSDRPVIVACRSGARSARAVKLLASHGLDVYNLTGGTQAWHASGLPLQPPTGRVA